MSECATSDHFDDPDESPDRADCTTVELPLWWYAHRSVMRKPIRGDTGRCGGITACPPARHAERYPTSSDLKAERDLTPPYLGYLGLRLGPLVQVALVCTQVSSWSVGDSSVERLGCP